MSPATAGGKVSRDLERVKGPVRVIVQYRANPAQSKVDAVRGRHKGQVQATLPGTKSLVADLPGDQVESLASDPDVLYVSADRPLQANMVTAGPAVGTISAIFQGVQGNGVTVAVIDSGVTEHTDLASRIVYAESFIDKLGQSSSAVADNYGHGTVVAGIVAGSGEASGGLQPVRGIAPKVSIVSLKALDGTGKAPTHR